MATRDGGDGRRDEKLVTAWQREGRWKYGTAVTHFNFRDSGRRIAAMKKWIHTVAPETRCRLARLLMASHDEKPMSEWAPL